LRHSRSLPIIPIKVEKDNMSQAQSVTSLIEAGRVFLAESAPWLTDYIDEMAGSPTASFTPSSRALGAIAI